MNRCSRMNRPISLIVCLSCTLFGKAAYPPPSHMSHFGPPTDFDYYRYWTRQSLKCMGTPDCCTSWKAEAPATIVYFNVDPCGCTAGHPSLRGCYGMVHPGPYYIANPPPTVTWPSNRPPNPNLPRPQAMAAFVKP